MLSTLVKGTIFPVVLIGSLFVFQQMLQVGVAPPIAVLTVTVGNLILVALLEILAPLRKEWAWWQDRQTINDLLHGLALSVLGPRLGEALLLTIMVSGAAGVAGILGDGIWPVSWPLWAQLILAIVFADFTEWAKHKLYHHSRYLWPIHALHHNPDRMHVAKGARLHFLEATVRYWVVSLPLIALGAPPEILYWYAICVNVLGNLNHSNIDMPIPGLLHYFLATPQVHRLHHAHDLDLGRSNLSSISMLPDLLFRTFRHPSKHPLEDVGIDENPIPTDLISQLLSPLLWPVLIFRLRAKEGMSFARRMTK